MELPIRCNSCGRTDVARYYKQYKRLLKAGLREDEALDNLQITESCCRIGLMTNNDVSERLIAAGRPVTVTENMNIQETAEGRPKLGEVGERIIVDKGTYPSSNIPKMAERVQFEAARNSGAIEMSMFTRYENVELFEAEPEPDEFLDESLVQNIGRLRRAEIEEEPPVAVMVQTAEVRMVDPNNFWQKLRWDLGKPLNSNHPFYDKPIVPTKNNFLIVVALTENYDYYLDIESNQALTPENLVREVNAKALLPIPDDIIEHVYSYVFNAYLTTALRYNIALGKENNNLVEIRRMMNLTNRVDSFRKVDVVRKGYKESGYTLVFTRQNPKKFNKQYLLLKQIFTKKFISSYDENGFTLNDGVTVNFKNSYFISDIITKDDLSLVKDKQILDVIYSDFDMMEITGIAGRPVVIVFVDNTILVLGSNVETSVGSFEMYN